MKRLRQKTKGERVLVLLTDGANNVGEVAPVKAAELAAREAIKIYTIGVGADELQLKMPSLFGALGSRIVNPSAELDEETLGKAVSPKEIYKLITDKIVAQIEANKDQNWEKTWKGSGYEIAYNFVSKKPYTSINQLLLGSSFSSTLLKSLIFEFRKT